MPNSNHTVKRRIAPSVPITLELETEGGGKTILALRLAFDFNAAVEIDELTGLSLLDGSIWAHISRPKVLSAMFYGALLAHHPEYRAEGGLEAVRSYMQESNAEAIGEALWKAYLLYLPADKRERMQKLRADAEAGIPRPLATPAATDVSLDGSSSGPSPVTISASATANSAV